MREQQDVAVEGARACDNPINSRAHLLGRLATGAAVAEDQPARLDLVNFLWRFSLVFAVVPLPKAGADDHVWGEPRQFAGLLRGLHCTAKSESREISGENWPHPFRKPAAMVGQGDIGDPRVFATKAPLRLTVPNREDVHV